MKKAISGQESTEASRFRKALGDVLAAPKAKVEEALLPGRSNAGEPQGLAPTRPSPKVGDGK